MRDSSHLMDGPARMLILGYDGTDANDLDANFAA